VNSTKSDSVVAGIWGIVMVFELEKGESDFLLNSGDGIFTFKYQPRILEIFAGWDFPKKKTLRGFLQGG